MGLVFAECSKQFPLRRSAVAHQPQLIKGHGAGGGHVQRVHSVGHGDAHGVVAGGDGTVGQTGALYLGKVTVCKNAVSIKPPRYGY